LPRSQYSSTDRTWAHEQLVGMKEPLDSIPYTAKFDEIFEAFNSTQITAWTRPDLWKLLLAARKKGLGGARRARTKAPKLNAKQQARLKDLMPRTRGEVDRLPYTSAFSKLYSEFSRYLSTPLPKRDVWLACLHISKMSIRKNARPMLDKSIRRMRAAINAFNRIGGENRLDDAIITVHHAMEMLLKAALLQHDVAIIDSETGHYSQFKPCLKAAVNDDKAKFLSQEDRQVLLAIDAIRGDAYHGLIQLDETEAYGLISSAVAIFQKTLWEVFWKDLADELGSLVLPISTIPLTSSAVLLNRKYQQIEELLRASDQSGALAAARPLAILEKATAGGDDARVTEKDVQEALDRVRGSETLQAAFPGIAGLPVTQTDSGATIFISVKRSGTGDAVQADRPDLPIAVEHRDHRDSHPFRFKELKERIGINQHQLQTVLAELKVKSRPECYHEHGPAKGQKTGGYSPLAVELIRNFVETYDGDLAELRRKHAANKKRPKTGKRP